MQHGQAILDFLLFLNDRLSRSSHKFKNNTANSPEEVNVVGIVLEHGSLKVKDIANLLPGIDPSKLSRLIDGLEKQSYITRTINPDDRRSFLIAPTEQGQELHKQFTEELNSLGESMLAPLTATEQVILVELFSKIQNNWDS